MNNKFVAKKLYRVNDGQILTSLKTGEIFHGGAVVDLSHVDDAALDALVSLGTITKVEDV